MGEEVDPEFSSVVGELIMCSSDYQSYCKGTKYCKYYVEHGAVFDQDGAQSVV